MVTVVTAVMVWVQVAVMVTAVMMVMAPAKEHPDHSHAIYGVVKPRCHIIK